MNGWLGALGSTVAGGAAGAGVYGVIGGVGVAAAGTAVGVTLGPFVAIGAGVGLTAYGLFWLGTQVGAANPPPAAPPANQPAPP